MTQKKLSVNIVYSLIVQISNFIAPLITAPYVARVLSAELIGDYSYVLANSSYFVLVENMGFTLYGTIKGAAIRDDKEKLSELLWEIVLLKFFFMIVCAGAYVIWFMTLAKGDYKILYSIMLLNIFANGADIVWFFNALEEYKVIAIRTVVIQLINVVSILIFVKSKNDFLVYAIIMQAAPLLGTLAVYPSLKEKIKWMGLRKLNIRQHIVPSLIYFVPGLVSTIFSSTDKTILGNFTKSSYEVGVYEQANKICQLCIGMISAVSVVILPRITYLYHNSKDKRELNRLLDNSVRGVFFVAIPVSLGIAAVSDYFIPIFFGAGYEKSILLSKILCLNVLFISLSNFMGHQCLIARGKQKEYNICVGAGALLNVIINICLVKSLQSVGVSIASSVTSFITFALIVWYGKDMIRVSRIVHVSRNYFFAAIIMFVSIYWINIPDNSIASLFIRVALGVVIYAVMLLISKDEITNNIVVKKITNKFKR